MADIIAPEFKRSLKHKLRLLKAKPELARLPEFNTDRPIVPTLVVAATLVAFVRFLHKRNFG